MKQTCQLAKNRFRTQRLLYPLRVLSMILVVHSYSVDEVVGEGVPARSEIEKVVRLGVDHTTRIAMELDVDDSPRKLALLCGLTNDKFALM